MTPFLVGHGEVRISSARSSSSKWIIALQPHGQVWLYTVDDDFVRELPHEIRSDTQPVFSRFSPDHIFTVNGNQIWQHDLRNDGFELVASFPEYLSLSASHAEGDLQSDGWLALCGVKEDKVSGATWEEPFLYNLHTNTKGPLYPQSEPYDGLKAAGSHLLLSKHSGIYDLTSGKQLTVANGHAACNADWLAWCTSDHPTLNKNAVQLVSLTNPYDLRILAEFDKSKIAMHLSMGEDCCYASVFAPDLSMPSQIIRLGFDGSRELLYEWMPHSYNALYQPRFSASKDYGVFNWWNGQECLVYRLRLTSKPNFTDSKLDTPWQSISYANKEHWKYRFECEVIGGRLTLLDVLEKAP